MAVEDAVRNYLLALKDPAALKDDDAVEAVRQQLQQTDDILERVKLQQQLQNLENPPLEQYEDTFVEHAKAWAEANGIGPRAFLAEGVPPAVLRRAGFSVSGRARDGRRRGGRPRTSTRTRTSSDEVRKAIPRGTFTVKDLQEKSGGSVQVVRNVIREEVEGGRVQDLGPDPDHIGPGRAPTLYKKG